MRHSVIGFIILLILSFWSVRPLLSAGFFPMHDDTQVARVIVMGKALREGQFPVRWVSDLGYGYGYPIFNFYGPLPYYVGGALYAFGTDPLVATKTMFVIGIVLSALTMYVLLNSILDPGSALVGSMLYLYAPYHAVQVYVRGAVGEFWAFGFFPLFLYGIVGALGGKQQKYATFVGGLGLAGIILSHTILGFVTTVFFAGVAGMYGFLQLVRKRTVKKQFIRMMCMFGVGLGASAFFWLPAYLEMGYTNVAEQIGSSANFRDHFVCLGQLWDSAWGFGGSIPGCVDGLSFKLGKIHVMAAVAASVGWFMRKEKFVKPKQLFVVAYTTTILSLVFMLAVSLPLWDILPLMGYVQYPWRFLAFTMAGLAIIAAIGANVIVSSKVRIAVATGIIFLTLLGNTKWFQPEYIYDRKSQEFASAEYLRFRVSRISDEYLPPGIVRPAQMSQIVRETIPTSPFVTVQTIRQLTTDEAYRVSVRAPTAIRINKAFFPGWQYWVDGMTFIPRVIAGLPVIDLSQGEHSIEMKFTNTPVRTVGNMISAATVILAGIWYAKTKKTIA